MGAPTPGWPAMVGPYRLVRQLGTGGMGVVYLGHHLGTGAAAAVKVIRPEHAADPTFRARLGREVAAARRVPRFCTAPILDAGLDDDPLWVATEYVDGPGLDTVLAQQGRLPGAALESLALGVAVALRAIHAHGVIHRDLKPSNVLLSGWGPRLIDFGIARITDEPDRTRLTQAGSVIGTPAFMAPEQLTGQPLTTAVDVFAWASLVTCAATGRRPFGTGAAALSAVLFGEPDLGDLPEPLRGLVTAAFAKDPAARPSAADLVDQLSRIGSVATSQVMATATAAGPPAQPGHAAALEHPAAYPGQPAPYPGHPAATGSGRGAARTLLAAGSVAAVLVVLVAVTVTITWLTRGDGPPPSGTGPAGGRAFEGTLTLGGLMPTQGPMADYGAGLGAAAELAVQDINLAGGVWGNDVVWVLEDEGSPAEPARTVAAGNSLITQGVNAVIGAVSSSASLAVLETMHDHRIIMVSPTSTSTELTGHPYGAYFFRTAGSDALHGNAVAELILADGHGTLAILAQEGAYGDGMADAIERTYAAGGGQVVHRGSFDPFDVSHAGVIAPVVDAAPEALVLVSVFEPDTERVVQALMQEGFTTEGAQWYLTNALTIAGLPRPLNPGTLTGAKVTAPIVEEAPAEFMVRVEELADGVPTPYHVTESYDAVMVVALAAVAAGSDDADAIRAQMVGITTGGTPCASFAECRQLLDSGEDVNYSGYSGVSWNEHGEPAEARISVGQFRSDNSAEEIDVVIGRL